MSEFIKGSCDEFCPKTEKELRTKEHLLNFYELQPGKKYAPGILIKAFSRSAAGTKAPKSSELRTIIALERTVEYLLTKILLDKRKTFNFAYDFIFDRLRCVRQEIVIQSLDFFTAAKLLEPIILFLAYSSYRLCTESAMNFDPKICNHHLQECLKVALCCYDELDRSNIKQSPKEIKNRRFIEALYQIFNLGSTDSLERSILLPKNIRDPMFCTVSKISLEYSRGNYYKVLQGIKKLPHVLCAVASLKAPDLRRKVLHSFSHAYNSNKFSVPIYWLQDLLLYSNLQDFISDCKYYNIHVLLDEQMVRFSKTGFNFEKTSATCRHELFVDKKLQAVFVPDILLLRKL